MRRIAKASLPVRGPRWHLCARRQLRRFALTAFGCLHVLGCIANEDGELETAARSPALGDASVSFDGSTAISSPPEPPPPDAESRGAMRDDAGVGVDASPAFAAEDAGAPFGGDCDYRMTVRAHQSSVVGDTEKFQVSADAQYTMAFFFKAPWKERSVQFVKARLLLDNKRVVHHWTLFAGDDPNPQDFEVRGGPDQGTPLKMQAESYVTGGGPGSPSDIEMPDDVGLRVPSGPNAFMRLEVHYFNEGNPQVEQDQSGFDICLTEKKRANEAAAHWLGTYLVWIPGASRTDISSTCAPTQTAGPVHLMLAAPHMHQSGVHARMVVKRNGAERMTLLDTPYTFEEQRGYSLPTDGSAKDVVLEPGDSIVSTCTYQNKGVQDIFWGEGSQDEMCFFVVLAWPTGRLSNGSLLGGLLGAPPDVSCLEPF